MTIRIFIKIVSLPIAWLALVACTQAATTCPPAEGVALQILGSGGPIADDSRASSGYIVWIDGKSRVLIDAGGGTFLRFGEAGATFEALDFIGLSHFHTDHSADFPALIKSGNFSDRDRSLSIAGPQGDGAFPGLKDFLQSMLGKDHGAYAYLSAFNIDALRVPHGIVPAAAFRVRAGDQTLVFATDQNGGNPAFADFAKGASVLVMHMVVPENVAGVGRRLHAPPSVIGEIAAAAAPGKLVLSHFMARSLAGLEQNVALVRERYKREVILAEDLACVTP
jgi:ribonuclease BN (tRNA processing enzyme)